MRNCKKTRRDKACLVFAHAAAPSHRRAVGREKESGFPVPTQERGNENIPVQTILERVMISAEKCEIMVGVSTGQNTANLVPFVQLGGQKMLLAQTEESGKNNWAAGIKKVIENRNGTCSLFSIGIGDNLADMIKSISGQVEEYKSVCWNFGGGQKLQQLAQFSVFQQRLGEKKSDWACYSDPISKMTQIIKPHSAGSKNIVNYGVGTDSYLEMKEIVTVFGSKTDGAQLLWKRGRDNNDHKLILPISEKDLSWFYDYEKRQNMFKHCEDAPADDIYPDGFEGLGGYFDKVVQYQVARLIGGNPDTHLVNEVWANVNVYDESDHSKQQRAEYDILLTTCFGTVIPLDAKSGIFKKKDEDARAYNLEKISGKYTSLYPVFPYFCRDTEPESALRSVKGGKELLKTPWSMDKEKRKILVLTDPGEKTLFLKKGRKNKIIFLKENKIGDNKVLRVNSLANIIDCLNLKRERP